MKTSEMSEQLETIGYYQLWFSEGDARPYWISNLQGEELFDFKTKKEMVEEVEEIWERQKALSKHLEVDPITIEVSDNYDEFYVIDDGHYEVVTMDSAIRNEMDFDTEDNKIMDQITDTEIGAYTLMIGSKYFVREL